MTAAIYGSLGQVDIAVRELSAKMQLLHEHTDEKVKLSGQTRTWAVISNPHPNLAFVLPRSIQVGV